jgi:hypothetical protein
MGVFALPAPNAIRFPEDLVFRLSNEETEVLVSQNVIPFWRSLGGLTSLCVHRAGRGYAFERSNQPACRASARRDYARS